jgi:hypothetical protein
LLPGETATFLVGTSGPLDPGPMARPPVLRSANDLCKDPN